MRTGIGERSAQLAILAVCVAAAVLILLVALDTTPIADDYGELPGIEHSGFFQYLHSYWFNLTDRYSNAVFMTVLVKLFGAAAIHIATPLLIAVLFCFCVVAAGTVVSPQAHSIRGCRGRWRRDVGRSQRQRPASSTP